MIEKLNEIREAIQKIHQKTIDRGLLEYGFDHSKRILSILKQIVSEENLLESKDIFILVAATYLHHIGNQIYTESIENIRTKYHEIGKAVLFKLERKELPDELKELSNLELSDDLTSIANVIFLHNHHDHSNDSREHGKIDISVRVQSF
ncbi:MAG: HD domain-containing protein [Desulfobacterales bacterium]|nr:HD domain-containing protein [Desulfobacterales bacterium]